MNAANRSLRRSIIKDIFVHFGVFVFGRLQTRAADDVRRKQKQTGAYRATVQG